MSSFESTGKRLEADIVGTAVTADDKDLVIGIGIDLALSLHYINSSAYARCRG